MFSKFFFPLWGLQLFEDPVFCFVFVSMASLELGVQVGPDLDLRDPAVFKGLCSSSHLLLLRHDVSLTTLYPYHIISISLCSSLLHYYIDSKTSH